MGVIASQINDNSTVSATACREWQQRKHPMSALLTLDEANPSDPIAKHSGD